jgi:hypothetical protein
MDIDESMREFRSALSRGRRIERVSEACLSFAELASEGLSPLGMTHVSECLRCRSLRERLLAAELEDEDIATVQDGPSRFWRAAMVFSPVVSAACLVAALSMGAAAPRNSPDLLHTQVLNTASSVDHALRVLGGSSRTSKVERLQRENELLRNTLRTLVHDVESLLQTARRPAEDPSSANGP